MLGEHYILDIPSSGADVALIMLARATGASLTTPSVRHCQSVLKGFRMLSDAHAVTLKGTNSSGDLMASGVITITLDDTKSASRSTTEYNAGITGMRK
jgi:hypothetical protein